MTKHFARWFLPLLLLLPLMANGQDERPPVTRAYFIDNATIIQQPGQVLEMGDMILRDGLIEAVGKDLKQPVDAQLVKGDSLYVYAGFIDGLGHVGVPKPKEDGERPRVKRPGNPPNHLAGIQPERHVAELLKADDKSVTDMRALGFTAAHSVPHGKMLPGKGAVILLDGDSGEEMVLRSNTALFSQFEGARRLYPATTMAIMSKWRELYTQAQQTKDHAKRYATTPRGMARPTHNDVLAAFYPAIDGTQPVFFAVDGIKEVHRAMSLAKELGFPLALANVGRAQLLLDQLKSDKTPLFLQLELPEAKDKKADKDKKEAATPAQKAEASLETRRAAAMKEFEEQAALLAKAGIPFGFSSMDAKPKDIRANLGRMIKAGLTEDQALAALTTAPADLLGLAAMLGSVEAGKIANLVVTDKPYFAEKSNVRYVFVDGSPTEYEVKKAKKKKPGDPDAQVNAIGSWNLQIDAPVETPPAVLTLTGSNDDLEGALESAGEENSADELSLNGDNLSFSVKVNWGGASLTLAYDLTIDGDSIEGSVTAGNYGTFDVEGSRKDPE